MLCFLAWAGAAQGSGLPDELSIMLRRRPKGTSFSDELAKMDGREG